MRINVPLKVQNSDRMDYFQKVVCRNIDPGRGNINASMVEKPDDYCGR